MLSDKLKGDARSRATTLGQKWRRKPDRRVAGREYYHSKTHWFFPPDMSCLTFV